MSDEVLESLAVLHARHVNADLPGVPVVDRTWWDNGFRHVDGRLSELLPRASEPAALHEALTFVRRLRGDPLLVQRIAQWLPQDGIRRVTFTSGGGATAP